MIFEGTLTCSIYVPHIHLLQDDGMCLVPLCLGDTGPFQDWLERLWHETEPKQLSRHCLATQTMCCFVLQVGVD